ncbi:MAG: hypothetical protein JNG84_05125, partial [Archangium sp.]|nr:hypothetical protein [Archangium sp.]
MLRWLAACVVLTSCIGEVGIEADDAGSRSPRRDGGVVRDGGSGDAGLTDAGTELDGGDVSDGGVELLDAGAADDAGTDAGALSDAGVPDAGAPDAGTPDAGVPDAGTADAGGAPFDAGITLDAGVPDSGMRTDGGVDGGSRYQFGQCTPPTNTFTLPAGSMYYTNLQTSFPAVNWQTLDRLYIPAGTYRPILLGNLPTRTPERPLIITNSGGQVRVQGTDGTARIELLGGSNWVFTGQYDPICQTGHANFPGHWNADYANSHGRYGVEVRQFFKAHSGIKVANSATDYELSYVEIWETGFAGLLLKTDGVPTATMRNVRVHDLYIHDTDAEGMYIGTTS